MSLVQPTLFDVLRLMRYVLRDECFWGDPDCDFFPIICTSNSEFFISCFQNEEKGGDIAAWGGL